LERNKGKTIQKVIRVKGMESKKDEKKEVERYERDK
jgi:hypothetical protein